MFTLGCCLGNSKVLEDKITDLVYFCGLDLKAVVYLQSYEARVNIIQVDWWAVSVFKRRLKAIFR